MMEWIISSSVLILAVIALRAILKGKMSLRLQYTLWALVLVRLLLPVSLGGSDLSVMNAAAQVPVVQDVEALQGVSGGIERSENGTVSGTPRYELMPDAPVTVAEETSEADFVRMRTVLHLRDLLRPLWLTGSVILLAVFALSNAKFRGALKKSRRRLEQSQVPLPVYLTDAVETPCLFGCFCPAIYLPTETAESPVVLRHALTHEMTHFYHGDHFWALLRCACLALHWYNPLVWWAAMLSRRDGELACDEGVLRRLGEGERAAYGNTLLDLTCAKPRASDFFRTATTMNSGKKSLKERVSLIARKPHMAAYTLLAVVLIAAIVVVCTFTGRKNESTLEEEPISLTAEELRYFNEEYFNDGGLANQFLSSLYETPGDIDLFELFYCGSFREEALTDEERQTVVDTFYDGFDPDCDCTKLSAANLDAALTQYMGLTLAESSGIGLAQFAHLGETDAYYHFHGDTNYRSEVRFTAGVRQGELVSLYYDDTFMANGAKVVTLRETEVGYHILSNNYAAAPAQITLSLPDETPVETQALDGYSPHESEEVVTESFARQDWGELVDSFWYQGVGAEEDHTILVGLWPDGGIYACYTAEGEEADARAYHRFLQITEKSYAQDYLNEPERIAIAPFTELFGYHGFILTVDHLCRYYIFDEDGTLRLLLTTYDLPQTVISTESGSYAVISEGGDREPMLLLERGGQLYHATDLMTRFAPEAFEPYLVEVLPDGGGVIRYADSASPQYATCTRRIYFDGEDLRLYTGDGRTYTDHVADDIDVPSEILTAAKSRGQAAYDLLRQHTDTADAQTWNLDDWRITSLKPLREIPYDGFTVAIYRQTLKFHSATPDTVVLAGGAYLTEDSWLGGLELSGEYNLLPFVIQDGDTTLLEGTFANDIGIDSEEWAEALVQMLEDAGLKAENPEEIWALLEEHPEQRTRILEGISTTLLCTFLCEQSDGAATTDGVAVLMQRLLNAPQKTVAVLAVCTGEEQAQLCAWLKGDAGLYGDTYTAALETAESAGQNEMERAVIQQLRTSEATVETSAEEATYPIYNLGVSYHTSPEAALTEERRYLGGTTSETQAAVEETVTVWRLTSAGAPGQL